MSVVDLRKKINDLVRKFGKNDEEPAEAMDNVFFDYTPFMTVDETLFYTSDGEVYKYTPDGSMYLMSVLDDLKKEPEDDEGEESDDND